MPAGLALFWAGALAVASHWWRPGLARVVALAIAFAAFMLPLWTAWPLTYDAWRMRMLLSPWI